MASALMDEPQIDIRDDSGKWMELISSVNLPETTVEAMNYGFNINSIGTMQASIRTEHDLDDFLFGILFQAGGPLLAQTGTAGWEQNLPETNYRVCRWGAAMTRIWEDCHQAVRASRMHPASASGLAPTLLSSSASFGQAIGQAIEVNLTARGEEPPVPRMDNKKRRDLLEDLMKTWPGILLREHNIPGPRYMDQLWNDRKPGKELKYYPWRSVTSVKVEKDIKKRNGSRPNSEAAWQARMMDPDLPQRDNIPNSHFQIQLLWEIRRCCHCITGWARHDIHLEYDTKCLDHFTATYDQALEKRAPNLTEFLAADEHIWNMPNGILQLVNNGTWTLSEVLHDVVHNRRDIELFMGPQDSSGYPSGKVQGKQQREGKGRFAQGVRKKQ